MVSKIPSLLLHNRGDYNHKPQATDGNIHEIYGTIITKASMNPPQNTPQYRVRIIYKPGPDHFIADWQSREHHKENKDEEIAGMQVNINPIETTTHIPDCMMVCEMQQETSQDTHL